MQRCFEDFAGFFHELIEHFFVVGEHFVAGVLDDFDVCVAVWTGVFDDFAVRRVDPRGAAVDEGHRDFVAYVRLDLLADWELRPWAVLEKSVESPLSTDVNIVAVVNVLGDNSLAVIVEYALVLANNVGSG